MYCFYANKLHYNAAAPDSFQRRSITNHPQMEIQHHLCCHRAYAVYCLPIRQCIECHPVYSTVALSYMSSTCHTVSDFCVQLRTMTLIDAADKQNAEKKLEWHSVEHKTPPRPLVSRPLCQHSLSLFVNLGLSDNVVFLVENYGRLLICNATGFSALATGGDQPPPRRGSHLLKIFWTPKQ